MNNKDCAICLENINYLITNKLCLDCHNMLCLTCFNSAKGLLLKCPSCRSKLNLIDTFEDKELSLFSKKFFILFLIFLLYENRYFVLSYIMFTIIIFFILTIILCILFFIYSTCKIVSIVFNYNLCNI